jgi:IMP cyclohydrolase
MMKKIVADDFSALKSKVYSGRGITMGRTPTGNPFIGYTLTGRSTPSQARKLIYDETAGVVRTSVTDPKELEKGSPALLLYPALAFLPNRKTIVASNGAQTKLLYSAAQRDLGATPFNLFDEALNTPAFEYDQKDQRWIDITSYEPDSNATPRINAILDNSLVFPIGAFAIIRKAAEGTSRIKERHHYDNMQNGRGQVITTYHGENEEPILHPFTGRPLDVQIESETAADIVASLYTAIGPNDMVGNARVGAAVMMLNGSGGLEVAVLNRSERGA